MTDFDPGAWRGVLHMLGLEYPDMVMIAAQDHGYHPNKSNRQGRFEVWERLLSNTSRRLEDLVFVRPPEEFTRLGTIQNSSGGGPVADSGTAAVLGALFVPEIETRNRETGICLVGIGNSHLVAFLVYQNCIWGVYEQHTGLLSGAKLWEDLNRFRSGDISFDQVFAEQEHGAMVLDFPESLREFSDTYVIGTQRGLLQGCEVQFPAPGSDMMLTGCFGLLKAWQYMSG